MQTLNSWIRNRCQADFFTCDKMARCRNSPKLPIPEKSRGSYLPELRQFPTGMQMEHLTPCVLSCPPMHGRSSSPAFALFARPLSTCESKSAALGRLRRRYNFLSPPSPAQASLFAVCLDRHSFLVPYPLTQASKLKRRAKKKTVSFKKSPKSQLAALSKRCTTNATDM